MNQYELEELRDNVAHILLSRMSKGTQFQFALDKMLDTLKDKTEAELLKLAPQFKEKKKPKGF